MQLSVTHDFLPKRPSTRTSMVMDHFGIDFEQGQHTIAEQLELPIEPGQTVLFTGASGSGKSSLLRAAADQLARADKTPAPNHPNPARLPDVVDVDQLTWESRSLIDQLPVPFNEAMQLLAMCGLAEAHLMLRTPEELSEGQRYRFRLALAVARRPLWIIADEFTATLDRILARSIAFNVSRIAARHRIGFLLATTHEDVAEDLQPDLHIRCRLDGSIRVTPKEGNDAASPSAKKKEPGRRSRSPMNSGSPPRPSATGRTSLGGITAATTSAARGS